MKIYCFLALIILVCFNAIAGETNTQVAISRQYDHALAGKIAVHWFEILDAMPVGARPPVGTIVLEFRLFSDGRVSDLKPDTTNVDESLIAACKQAVLDSAPFAHWTKEMRQVYTNDYRVIHYTFKFMHQGEH